jgi:hypothetical protein
VNNQCLWRKTAIDNTIHNLDVDYDPIHHSLFAGTILLDYDLSESGTISSSPSSTSLSPSSTTSSSSSTTALNLA